MICSRSFLPIYALSLTYFGVSTHFTLHTKSKNLPADAYRGSTLLIQETWSKIRGLHKPLHGLKVPFLSLGSTMAPYRVSGGRTKPTLFSSNSKDCRCKIRTDKVQICSNGLREENRNPKNAMTKAVPCLSRCYPFAFIVTVCR